MRSPGINGEGELRGQPANPGSPGKMAVETECVCGHIFPRITQTRDFGDRLLGLLVRGLFAGQIYLLSPSVCVCVCDSVAEWLGHWTCEQQVAGSSPGLSAVECNPVQVVNTRVPLSPSSIIWYIPANGRWCLVAGKVTVGLASHWPRVTDISGSPSTHSRPRRGRWAPAYALLMEYGELYLFYLLPSLQSQITEGMYFSGVFHSFCPCRPTVR